MSSRMTKIDEFEHLERYLLEETRPMFHFATKRMWGLYMHHYIVLGETWSSVLECCDICQYTSKLNGSYKGKVKLDKYFKVNFVNDIKDGLYLVEDDENYPNPDFQQAFLRLKNRLENKEHYSITANNCEHLVVYILTGIPNSSQVMEASFFSQSLMDILNPVSLITTVFCAFSSSLVKVLSTVGYFKYIREQLKKILEIEGKKHGIIAKVRGVFVRALKRIYTNINLSPDEKYLISECWKGSIGTVVNCDKAMAYLRKCACRYRYVIIGSTFAFTFIFTCGCAYFQEKTLKESKRDGTINIGDYERERKKVGLSGLFRLVLSLVMSFNRRDYSRQSKVFLENNFIIMLAHVLFTLIMNICTKINCNPFRLVGN